MYTFICFRCSKSLATKMAAPSLGDLGMDGLNTTEMSAAANVLSRPAEEFGNDTNIEMQWAIKAYHHAETYFNLISSVEPKMLRLTKYDDNIYSEFRKEFSELKVDVLDQEALKSQDGKQQWRNFCEQFKDLVDEYNFASLIRTDCKQDYSEENSFVVPKIQFLAIEIARNREGYNSTLRETHGQKDS